MSKYTRFNVLDDIDTQYTGKGCVILRKVQRTGGGWLVRLSNKGIQLLTNLHSYLFLGKKLW